MSNEVLSQDQIEKMLAEAGQIDEAKGPESPSVDDYLTKEEQDLLGEIGNICMSIAATTMSTLLGRKVTITTPHLRIETMSSLMSEYPAPLVVSEIKYIEGLEGDNLLILKEFDVARITNLMLGDDTEITEGQVELNEIHMSAIGEVMNQMVGSSATALADILDRRVDISTPRTQHIRIEKDNLSGGFSETMEPFVRISFMMEIEGLLKSEIMQVLTVDFAKGMARTIMDNMNAEMSAPPVTQQSEPEPAPVPQAAPAPQMAAPAPQMAAPAPQMAAPVQQTAPPMQEASAAAYDFGAAEKQRHQVIHEQQNVSVQEPQFPSFNDISGTKSVPGLKNIAMILDVPMNVTVELGRVKRKIKEILDFTTGSVVVLDRPAGEMVDILVNGKCIGKGEVVVIDENYGIRVTEINMPEDASQLF